jgi:hypothetical protein
MVERGLLNLEGPTGSNDNRYILPPA